MLIAKSFLTTRNLSLWRVPTTKAAFAAGHIYGWRIFPPLFISFLCVFKRFVFLFVGLFRFILQWTLATKLYKTWFVWRFEGELFPPAIFCISSGKNSKWFLSWILHFSANIYCIHEPRHQIFYGRSGLYLSVEIPVMRGRKGKTWRITAFGEIFQIKTYSIHWLSTDWMC